MTSIITFVIGVITGGAAVWYFKAQIIADLQKGKAKAEADLVALKAKGEADIAAWKAKLTAPSTPVAK